LAVGAVLDAVLGDPARMHPVAGFGAVAAAAERRLYRDDLAAGAAHTALLVAGAAGLGAVAEKAAGGRAARVLLTAAATWTVLGGASLRRTGRRLGADLARGDLAAARNRLPALCGRDPAGLDGAGLARAGVESLAENTSDAVVAPLLWGAVAGLPGLFAYRAVNTLDAMVGHRDARHRRFGWAAARLDDAANAVPARLAALLACACAGRVGGAPADAYWVMRRDGGSHPSPNAGQVEAAFAGALGLRLGGELRYPHGVEHRPLLGFGRPAAGDDLARAADLSAAVTLAALVLSAAASAAVSAAGTRTRQPGCAGPAAPTTVPTAAPEHSARRRRRPR
jgi:adenosylcobinamide-phosphate synthase